MKVEEFLKIKKKNSTISILFMCIAKMKRKDIIAWGL